jgi:hypothetical protein
MKTKTDQSIQAQLDSIKFEVPLFPELIQPNGFLDRSREAHALWFYYTRARLAFETHLEPIVIQRVGDLPTADPEVNYRQLFTSVAQMYGVKPEAMAKCWDMVDMQCAALKLPPLPDKDKYRHNVTPEIKTQ